MQAKGTCVCGADESGWTVGPFRGRQWEGQRSQQDPWKVGHLGGLPLCASPSPRPSSCWSCLAGGLAQSSLPALRLESGGSTVPPGEQAGGPAGQWLSSGCPFPLPSPWGGSARPFLRVLLAERVGEGACLAVGSLQEKEQKRAELSWLLGWGGAGRWCPVGTVPAGKMRKFRRWMVETAAPVRTCSVPRSCALQSGEDGGSHVVCSITARTHRG